MTTLPGQFAGLAGGVVAFVAIFIALFSVVLLVPIILIVANRAEPDQRGQRSHSVYLFGMSFVTLAAHLRRFGVDRHVDHLGYRPALRPSDQFHRAFRRDRGSPGRAVRCDVVAACGPRDRDRPGGRRGDGSQPPGHAVLRRRGQLHLPSAADRLAGRRASTCSSRWWHQASSAASARAGAARSPCCSTSSTCCWPRATSSWPTRRSGRRSCRIDERRPRSPPPSLAAPRRH